MQPISVVPRATYVLAGEGHLEQILDNVLANAMDVAPPDTDIVVDATVVDATDVDSLVRVTVTDSGPGLSAENQRRALDRFWTRRPEGSGLGLSIVDQLARENRGAVLLEPNPAGGLVVALTLPTADISRRTRYTPDGVPVMVAVRWFPAASRASSDRKRESGVNPELPRSGMWKRPRSRSTGKTPGSDRQ